VQSLIFESNTSRLGPFDEQTFPIRVTSERKPFFSVLADAVSDVFANGVVQALLVPGGGGIVTAWVMKRRKTKQDAEAKPDSAESGTPLGDDGHA